MRYEIKNITSSHDVLAAMEKQMRAEREKRALILISEGQRDAAINSAEGEKQQVIKASEANKQQQINEAEGEAAAIMGRSLKRRPTVFARSQNRFSSLEVSKRYNSGSPITT
jgi:regulator of protease activity HflC (stomatin/prohibitin superfamily)